MIDIPTAAALHDSGGLTSAGLLVCLELFGSLWIIRVIRVIGQIASTYHLHFTNQASLILFTSRERELERDRIEERETQRQRARETERDD